MSDRSEDLPTLLAEFLERVDRDGPGALEEFDSEHPGFASRLGKHMDWLLERCYLDRDESLPETIGPYRVRGLIGSGGMGEVYLAEQEAPFRRAVAVKVIKLGMDTQPRIARFTAEIQALASLNHDGIARVFEAGTADGRPYFAMEYVPGQPITEYCEEHGLGIVARLELFVDVCRAVEYAHQQGIIHRDLKPSNILVCGPPSAPVTKIIDFGLAKAIDRRLTEESFQTQPGHLVGTPEYMSPEQADADGDSPVDTRADVYSLGVILYGLVTGMLPISLRELGATTVSAVIRAICEVEPVRPSVRVTRSGPASDWFARTCGFASHRELHRRLSGDLDWIVMQALEKEPDRRYRGVAQLADDVVHHLRFEPVTARPQTRRYLLAKFVRRHRAAVSVTATILILVVASLVTIYVYAMESQRRLEQGNLFGLVRWVDSVRSREWRNPPPARPEGLDDLWAWQADVAIILQQRELMQTHSEDPARVPTGEARPSDWANGVNAQRELEEGLRKALATLAEMTAANGDVAAVEKRIEWAQDVVEATVERHHAAWERVRREVAADPRLACDLKPQVGLVPLEPDPETHLQEFALLLPGGEIPERRDGRYAIGPTTCPVFVLVPGGETLIGCQDRDPDAPRYDPNREPNEAAVEKHHVEPFFASKFEFTHGQWRLLTGLDLTTEFAEWDATIELTHPVMLVTKAEILRLVRGWGMRLPSSVEWEYLARAGSDDPWWCGETAACLQRTENVFDQSLEGRGRGEGRAVPWSDGFVVTAPVGSFAPNRFGLYDVLGNVCEVCIEEVGPDHVLLDARSGSWHLDAQSARVTGRFRWFGTHHASIGFRPVISIER